MTKREAAKRVAFWQWKLAELGTGAWRIEEVDVAEEMESGKGVSASVSTSADYNSAWFQLHKDHLQNATAQRIDEDIVHEWLHVAWRDMDEVMKQVESWMPDATLQGFKELVDHEREGLIESTARLIVRLHGETC